MGKHLVFVGAGHAHLTALSRCNEYINRGHQVSVISPSSHHYYSGMGPGMLAGIYRPQDIRFHIKKMVEDRGAYFIPDSVVSLDPRKRVLHLKSGEEVAYDVVSFNIGSGVPLNGLSTDEETIFPVKPISGLLKARERLLRTPCQEPKIVVIGGGPAGVEITGCAWRLLHDHGKKARISLVPGDRLLPGFPPKASLLAMRSLQNRGISLLQGVRAEAVEDRTLRLSDSTRISFDMAFVATGVRPPSLFRDSGLPTGETRGLLVNKYLQSVAHPEVFGGGDCIDLEGSSLAKVGVYAVRQNRILFQNLLAVLDGGPLQEFRPQRRFLLILNLGDGTGLLHRANVTVRGKMFFRLKDYIDQKFMRNFQLSGERDEEP
jgi:NADH dehydrogenase FAD-containing subunit